MSSHKLNPVGSISQMRPGGDQRGGKMSWSGSCWEVSICEQTLWLLSGVRPCWLLTHSPASQFPSLLPGAQWPGFLAEADLQSWVGNDMHGHHPPSCFLKWVAFWTLLSPRRGWQKLLRSPHSILPKLLQNSASWGTMDLSGQISADCKTICKLNLQFLFF